MKKAVFNWSGGKDSAHALWKVLKEGEYEIVALLTTMNASTHRPSMHDIPLDLLHVQSRHIGIPLAVVDLKPGGNMEDYDSAMKKAVLDFKKQGVTHFIYGDIFLHDVMQYRKDSLAPYGIEVVEPLWNKSSEEVMEDFLRSGLKTVVVTTMDDGLGSDAIGKVIDREFVESLPKGYDPNGENGEYHSFCYDGPIFASPVPFRMGEILKRSFDIGLQDGSTKTFTYCFANLQKAEEV